MTMNEYQEAAHKTAVYPADKALEYLALGLAGEAGEVANKVKKILRGDAQLSSFATTNAIADELADCQWYLAELASAIGWTLDDLAEMNLAKLKSRAERGTLRGSGDGR